MRQTRSLTFAAVLALAVLVPAGPAAAAAPTNDTLDGAVALDFGDTITVDTTEATTDATDDAYFENCNPKHADATVWYTFTSEERTGVDIDTFDSSYSVGMLVTTGTPGEDLETVLCGGGRFTAEAGVEYTIVLFDDQRDEKHGRYGMPRVRLPPGGRCRSRSANPRRCRPPTSPWTWTPCSTRTAA